MRTESGQLMKTVSVIVPIHNRLIVTREGIALLERGILAYGATEDPACEFQVVVVDDGSTDGSPEWVAEHHVDFHLLRGDGSLWWSGAVNMGVEYAMAELASDYVLLWLDDLVPDERYFHNVAALVASNTESIVGSLVRDFHTKERWSNLHCFSPATGISRRRGRKCRPRHLRWVTGMGVLVPAEVVRRIGLWDAARFPQYFGDMDYCLRASKAGVEVACMESMVIYNRTEYSSYLGTNLRTFLKSLSPGNKGSRYNLAIRARFLRTHCSTPAWVLTYLAYYLKYAFSTLLRASQGGKAPSRPSADEV